MVYSEAVEVRDLFDTLLPPQCFKVDWFAKSRERMLLAGVCLG